MEEEQVLFTINNTFGGRVTKVADIYGPTKEKLEKTKPVPISSKYAKYILAERRERIKKLDSHKNRNKYFKENKIDELEKQKNEVIKETNWKLRVLEEQYRNYNT